MKIVFSSRAAQSLKAGITIFLALTLFAGIIAISRPANAVASLKTVTIRPTVVLDAGHGGFDGGATSLTGSLEKDINLQIAKKTSSALHLFGFDVVMTRSDDSALANTKKDDMYARLDIIKNTPDSVFVSIHQNHYSQGKYFGAQMFYGSSIEQESRAMALILQENFRQNLNAENTRQAKAAPSDLFLFKNAPQPSVLVECGFLSNYEETRLLENEEYQTKIALTIAQSICEYYQNAGIERNQKYGSTEV